MANFQSENKKLHILHFKLLNLNVCIDINYIVKVLPLMHLEKIPLSQNYVAGLMNISGKSIPVIDLALFLNMERKHSYSLNMPILFCKNDNEQLGLIVDSTQTLSSINENDLQIKKEFDESHSPFSAITIENNEQTFLLDMKKIFSNCSSLQTKLKKSMEEVGSHHG